MKHKIYPQQLKPKMEVAKETDDLPPTEYFEENESQARENSPSDRLHPKKSLKAFQ